MLAIVASNAAALALVSTIDVRLDLVDIQLQLLSATLIGHLAGAIVSDERRTQDLLRRQQMSLEAKAAGKLRGGFHKSASLFAMTKMQAVVSSD
jgi:hypothetical protein